MIFYEKIYRMTITLGRFIGLPREKHSLGAFPVRRIPRGLGLEREYLIPD